MHRTPKASRARRHFERGSARTPTSRMALALQNRLLIAANDRLEAANAALEISRDGFRALHDLAPTPFVIVDAGGTIVDVNRAGEALLQAPRVELIGRLFAPFLEEAGRAALPAFLAGVLALRCPHPVDAVLSPDAITNRHVEIDGVPVGDVAEAPRCLLAIADLTARDLAEAERHGIRNDVLATVSHDLRGPLSAIELATDALAADTSSAGAVRFVAVIKRAADRASRLISDLVEVTRLESGALQLAIEAIQARDLIEAACRDHELAAARAGVEISRSLPPESVRVLADPDRVSRVMANLIRNALIHAPGSQIEISATPRASEVLFAVADWGPGISPADRARVFDRFWQGPARRGSGLGLAIARGIVEAHRGTISVSSAVGAGSRFEFSLPRCRP